MPEGPELHLASLFVNTSCAGLVFAGAVEKSEVSKNPEVPFSCPKYSISSVSRGKEVKLILTPASGKSQVVHIVFRFGMSGSFKMRSEDEIPKHAHLRFYSKESPRKVLCFVDPRRFGSWQVNGSWQPERGPCVMTEYDKFRHNVLSNLSDKIFDKPICEAMLNQKYFNGIGNYLRAEILFRLQIPPFVPARLQLEALKQQNQDSDNSKSKKVKIKNENPDLLQLCNLVPLEVLNIEGKGYYPGQFDDYSIYKKWLRCYLNPAMKTLQDHNGRTVWFQGDPGPLAPKGKKAQKRRQAVGKEPKALKVEKAGTKRNLAKSKDVVVKREKKAETEHESKNAVKQIVKKKGKKESNKTVAKKGRKASSVGSPRYTPIQTRNDKKKVPELKVDQAANITRLRRLKSETATLTVDSPKPNIRELRNTAGRRSNAKYKS